MPEKQSRTTVDLIRELEIEAAHSTVALAVGFEHTTLFVFSGADDNLTKLNYMVSEGGEPIGFLMFHLGEERKVTSIARRPLEEYAAEPWAQDYLEDLVHGMVGRLDR